MEVVISYGYVILFSAAFPLVPLIAFICNSLELRIDAWKLCNLTRRPNPDVAGSIGMWGGIMRFICYAGAITNTAIIVFTAGIFDMIEDTTTKWLIFLLIEHILLLIKIVISYIIADVPKSVRLGL
mmetsp:Transcript_27171/g.5014  ORF Transcript_27171/g.5014 Transcript_27171/m.5014 type:complete len:126 (+) Transcript_27171:1870-2247(+)